MSEEILQVIRETIKTEVNGKIDNLRKEVSLHVESETEWKKQFQPMLDAFNDKKIVSMFFDKRTNTIYVYSKRVLTVVALATALWGIIKWLLTR